MRRTALAAATVGAFALGAATSWAGSSTVIATDDEFNQPSFYDIDAGQVASLVNEGPNNTHNVTADGDGPDGGPLFRTGNVVPGASRPVNGTQFLEGGEYDFHCTIHPEMQAAFRVDDTKTDPVPRPEISLKVKSKRLEKVVESDKLKVRVTSLGPTDADNVTLEARKGRKKIAKGELDVEGGDRDTEKLKLTKKGEKKLDDLDRAKVKVEGTVEFGFGDNAKRKLK